MTDDLKLQQQILDLYNNQNLSTYQIAEKLQTYPNKVRRILVKNGVSLRTKSEAQKNAINTGISEHPTKGKKRSDTTKKKISESQGKVWEKMNDEERIHRSLIGKESWNKKTEEEKTEIFKRAGDAIREAARNGSKLEKFLLTALMAEGFNVQFHKTHWLQNSNLEIDLFIPELRTVIEVDGPSHFEPVWGEDNLNKNRMSDSQKNGLVLRQGMVMIRIRQNKRLSQRYMRLTLEKLLTTLRSIKASYPTENERYIQL